MHAIVPETERPLFVCACGVEVRETMLMLTYSRVPLRKASRGTADTPPPCWVKVREETETVAKHWKASVIEGDFPGLYEKVRIEKSESLKKFEKSVSPQLSSLKFNSDF